MRNCSSLQCIVLLIIISLFTSKNAFSQFNDPIEITSCTTEAEVIALIDSVFLDGVNPQQYKNIEFQGDPKSVGYFKNGFFFGFDIPIGIVMSTGQAELFEGTNSCSSVISEHTLLDLGDPDLDDIMSTVNSRDACIIEFDFMPSSDTAKFSYVFGSEEYHQYSVSTFNDAFGFFLSGDGISGSYTNNAINIALVPGTTNTPVAIKNINCGNASNCDPPPGSGPNCDLLNNNRINNSGQFNNFGLNAYTDDFVAKSEVQSCTWYHIKLTIADASDQSYDSGVFLEKGSFDPGSVTENTAYSHPTIDTLLYEGCKDHDAVLYFSIGSQRVAPYIIPYEVSGTATRGTDYTIINTSSEDEIYIAPGELYDSLIIRPFWDSEVEGVESVEIIYNPVMCNLFSTPDTTKVFISDTPEFNNTNVFYNTYCEDVVTVGFEDVLTGLPPYSYLWTNGGQTTPTLDYSISGTDSVALHCVVYDTCGRQVSDTAFILVPDLISNAGPDKSMCNQPTVELEGECLGAQSFLWTADPSDPSLSGQQNDTTPDVSPLVTTEYILTNTDNCTNSDQDTVIVNLDGAVANASADNSICLHDSIEISINLGNTNETYQWTSIPLDNGLTSQSTNQTIKVSPTSSTKYSVLVTDDCNYQATDEVEITVNQLPSANAGINNEICFGDSYDLDANGGIDYQWGSIPSDPSLIVNDQDTLANPNVTPGTQELYKYYVTVIDNNGCVATDTMDLMVNLVPNITLSPDVSTVCYGDTAIIDAVGVADDYVWTSIPNDPNLVAGNVPQIEVHPETTTTYYLTATVGGINCPAKPEQIITVIPQLSADFEFYDNATEACQDESVGITYTGNASATANYTWDFGSDAIINNGSGGGPYDVSWNTTGNHNIKLNVSEFGCPSDDYDLNIDIVAMPLTDFEATPEDGCAELEVEFSSLSSNLDNREYYWEIDGSTYSDSVVNHTFTTPGTYSVTLTTTNRSICQSYELKQNMVTVFEVPVADFEADPTETILEQSLITFINNSTSQDILSHKWDFGDGDSSFIENPQHEYISEGSFPVILQTTSANGCVNETSKTVTIHPDYAIFPPNAFTPNGDGENDTFKVKGTGINNYTIHIFNRWGQQVFEADDINDEWDGKFDGEFVQNGTYIYTITYESMVNIEYQVKGSVTVIR